MKQSLLFIAFLISFTAVIAQEKNVSQLPSGKYETVVKQNQHKWERGDIVLIDESRYSISTSNEIGEYKFSPVAQRIFFTSGPLKNVFAKTSVHDAAPVIVLPAAENTQSGLRTEVWCYLKQ